MELVYSVIGTFSGICMVLLGVGFSLSLRPWPNHPALRPWVASYGVNALTLLAISTPLLIPSLSAPSLQLRTFALLNSGFFLVAGLQAFGWLRMRHVRWAAAVAVVPMVGYLLLFHLLGGTMDARVRVLVFSGLQAILQGATAIWAYLALRGTRSRLAFPVVTLLAAHTAFYLGRCIFTLAVGANGDFALSVAIAVLEGLLFNVILSYLQWSFLTEEAA
jgi:hypothetical protein